MYLQKMFLNYLIGVVSSLKLIHTGTFLVKIKASIKLGFLLSIPTFIWDGLSRWGIANSDYISIVLVAIVIDHALGTWRHLFVDRDFDIVKNITGISIKVGLVVCMGILFEGLGVIIKEESIVKDYLVIVTRLIVFLYPAGSAFANSSILSNGKFPPQAWLEKLKAFQSNLNPKDLGNNE